MTTFHAEEDFAVLVDNLEEITVRRQGSTKAVIVTQAYRHRAETEEAEPSGGATLQTDAVWHLQLPTNESGVQLGEVQLGDVVIDKHKQRWTVLEVQQLSKLGRCKCVTRELRIAHGCNDRVDIERPVWDDLGNGPEIVDWTYVCMALPVKIQIDEMIFETSTTPPIRRVFFDIILSKSIAMEPGDRLTAEDGISYQLQSLHQAERIDALPIARAVREEVV